jgi:hypothetical protein
MVFCTRRVRLSHIILSFVFALCLAASAFAQTTGTITGTVTDSTGAAVPGATVTVTNVGTKVARTVKSDAAGRYTASALNIGTYNITASFAGFKLTDLKGVNLDIGQVLSEPLTLAVGGSNEEVSVEAAAVTTDTQSSTNAQVIGEQQVSDLPLANRQFYNLVEVAPGVVPPAQNSSMGFRGGMNINGAAETANMFTVNGTDNIDISTNQAVFRPSVDTIAEFKVITGVASADYGRMSGGQIVLVTKQGSNKFHGSLYEYIRNGAIEAKPWNPNIVTTTPAFKQNTFGGTIGGPIMKDKAFFFFGYEGQRIRQQITAQSTVPTAAQQAGCATSGGNDPLTGAATATHYTLLAPAAAGPCALTPDHTGYDLTTLPEWNSPSAVTGRLLTSLVYPTNPAASGAPQPTSGLALPSNNYNFNETRKETMDEENTRFDYKRSDKDSFFGSFNHYHDPSFEPNNALCSSRTLPKFGCFTDQITWLFNVGENHIFTPNLLNTVVFGWNRLQQPRTQEDATAIGGAWQQLPGAFTGPVSNQNLILGVPSVTEPTPYTATGGQTNLPQNRWDNSFDFDEALTWTHKAHTYKVGAQFLIIKTTEFEATTARGALTFNPSTLNTTNSNSACTACGTTGDAIGDTQLGYVSSDSDTPTAPNIYNRLNTFDFFVMDDWKIKSNLVLNLGLRYELDMPESEKFGAISTFSPSVSDPYVIGTTTVAPVNATQLATAGTNGSPGLANANGGFVTAASVGQKALYTTDRNNFAPRLGFAWQPFHNEATVVKGAYGIFFNEPQAFNEFLGFSTQYPIRYGKTFTPTAVQPAGGGNNGAITLAAPFPNELPAPGTPYCVNGTIGCNAPVIGQACGNPCNLVPVVTGTEVSPHYATPYVSQWTLGLQRQVTKSILAEALYFGNKGTKIAFGCTSNINPNANPDAFLPNQNYTTKVGTPTVSAVASGKLQGLKVYPQWGAISFHGTSCNSYYHSLQSRVQVTTKSGISVLVSYTYARAEDGLTAAQNPIRSGFDKKLSDFDIRNRLVISPVIALPFGKGKMFANSGMSSAIFGGFKVSGIYQYFTGRPFSTTDSSPQSSSAGGGDRPDLITGASLTGNDPYNHTATHNKYEWFNVHALAYNPPGTYGTLAPNTIEGPGWDELDLTFGRTFAIKEYAKAEFKLDAFNLLNHPNLYNPLTTAYGGATTFLSTAYPTSPGYCPAGAPPSVTNAYTANINGIPCTAGGGVNGAGSFGTITQANPMREIQASLHITF